MPHLVLNLSPKKKLAGLATPLFALRGSADLGIGDVQALYELVDWCAEIGFGVLQILPINETSSDHSPYNLLSSIAIEPSTIATTPEFLPDLPPENFHSITGRADLERLRAGDVLYPEIKALKLELLLNAFKHLSGPRAQAFIEFQKKHDEWLRPYSLFRGLMHLNNQSEYFPRWAPGEHNYSSAQASSGRWSAEKKDYLNTLQKFYSYVQWVAFSQWRDLKRYAESRGVTLMGDAPIGVSPYSADTWEFPHLFDLTHSCGAPAEKDFYTDAFTKNWGQNWGFPLYNWEEMLKDNCGWWRRRLHILRSIFHLLRIDHVLGFYRMYAFPWYPANNARFACLSKEAAYDLAGDLPRFIERDDRTEENRSKNRAQGEKLLRILLQETGPYRLIAEDLGTVPPYMGPSLQELQIPGHMIPMWKKEPTGELTRNYPRLTLATHTTHDHPPLKALWDQWLCEAESKDPIQAQNAIAHMRELLKFAGQPFVTLPQKFTKQIHLALLKGLFTTDSWLAIPTITDLLGTAHRFNVPGTQAERNWRVRLEVPVARWITKERKLTFSLRNLVKTTCRQILYD
ncbi:MAG: hypothetical protein C5B47_04060 [Verrucomicrobia bacterium]|nr:MAG: hypothetical protein C5B47_04060 [Verrucomicrobiota bacterium]